MSNKNNGKSTRDKYDQICKLLPNNEPLFDESHALTNDQSKKLHSRMKINVETSDIIKSDVFFLICMEGDCGKIPFAQKLTKSIKASNYHAKHCKNSHENVDNPKFIVFSAWKLNPSKNKYIKEYRQCDNNGKYFGDSNSDSKDNENVGSANNNNNNDSNNATNGSNDNGNNSSINSDQVKALVKQEIKKFINKTGISKEKSKKQSKMTDFCVNNSNYNNRNNNGSNSNNNIHGRSNSNIVNSFEPRFKIKSKTLKEFVKKEGSMYIKMF